MIYSGRKVVAVAGTPVTLTSTRTPAGWVTVQAWSGNTGAIYIGGSTAAKDDGTNKAYTGHQLLPGDFLNLREMGGPSYLDLQYVYMDADNAADGCCFNYGRR